MVDVPYIHQPTAIDRFCIDGADVSVKITLSKSDIKLYFYHLYMDAPPIKLELALVVSDPLKIVAGFVIVYLYSDLVFKIGKFVLRHRLDSEDVEVQIYRET